QSDRKAAWETVCQVFGWAPAQWVTDLAKGLGVITPKGACAGAVVFHDGWPDDWPKLVVDILNSHHSSYYQGVKNAPPGDWEGPVPVYFLSVPAGQRFTFGLSARRQDGDAQKLVKLAL